MGIPYGPLIEPKPSLIGYWLMGIPQLQYYESLLGKRIGLGPEEFLCVVSIPTRHELLSSRNLT